MHAAAAVPDRSLRASGPQSVTFVELFFDLVFVFAVTQVTAFAAHHLTVVGIVQSLLLFWLIWWAWTQFTWTLNPADTTHSGVRLITLIATGAAFVMATSVPRAFAEDALWFAIPYIVVRVLGLGLQVLLEVGGDGPTASSRGVFTWVSLSLVGLVFVLGGAIADPSIRAPLWGLMILADLVAAGIAGKAQDWDLNPAHLSERHGLFVIIAIGESLIVAGTAVAGDERTVELVSVAGLVLLVARLLWWTYFGWLKDALEHGMAAARPHQVGPLARDVYSLAHFPLICGIVAFAVAIEEIVIHPGDPAPTEVVAALGLGVALFVGFSAVSFWRLHGRVLVTRLVVLALMVPGLIVVAPLEPVWPLAVVAVALGVLVVAETIAPVRVRAAAAHA